MYDLCLVVCHSRCVIRKHKANQPIIQHQWWRWQEAELLNYIPCNTLVEESDRRCLKCHCILIRDRERLELQCVSSQGHCVMTTLPRLYEWSWCDDDSVSGSMWAKTRAWGLRLREKETLVNVLMLSIKSSLCHYCKSLFTCHCFLLTNVIFFFRLKLFPIFFLRINMLTGWEDWYHFLMLYSDNILCWLVSFQGGNKWIA